MNRKSAFLMSSAAVWLAVASGLAISAQDKYTVEVTGGREALHRAMTPSAVSRATRL